LAKVHKELKPFGSRSANSMKKIVLESMTDHVKFKSLVEMKVDHYCGIHTKCLDIKSCLKSKSIESEPAKIAFLVTY
jgi:hypothetical protein